MIQPKIDHSWSEEFDDLQLQFDGAVIHAAWGGDWDIWIEDQNSGKSIGHLISAEKWALFVRYFERELRDMMRESDYLRECAKRGVSP